MQRGVRRVGACPVCELAQQPGFAEHVRVWRQRFLGAEAPDRVEIGVAACSHHCNHTLVHEIAIVARRHGYSIAIGGKGDALPSVARWLVEGIPTHRVPEVVDHVLATYRRLARGRERLSRVVARVGLEPFRPPGLDEEAIEEEVAAGSGGGGPSEPGRPGPSDAGTGPSSSLAQQRN